MNEPNNSSNDYTLANAERLLIVAVDGFDDFEDPTDDEPSKPFAALEDALAIIKELIARQNNAAASAHETKPQWCVFCSQQVVGATEDSKTDPSSIQCTECGQPEWIRHRCSTEKASEKDLNTVVECQHDLQKPNTTIRVLKFNQAECTACGHKYHL